ncbi:hypothetical protein ACPF3R_003371 [Vibrio cholerae]
MPFINNISAISGTPSHQGMDEASSSPSLAQSIAKVEHSNLEDKPHPTSLRRSSYMEALSGDLVSIKPTTSETKPVTFSELSHDKKASKFSSIMNFKSKSSKQPTKTVAYCWVNTKADKGTDNLIPCTEQEHGLLNVINNAKAVPEVNHVIYIDRRTEGKTTYNANIDIPSNVKFVRVDELLTKRNMSNPEVANKLKALYDTSIKYGSPAFAKNMVSLLALNAGDYFLDIGVSIKPEGELAKHLKGNSDYKGGIVGNGSYLMGGYDKKDLEFMIDFIYDTYTCKGTASFHPKKAVEILEKLDSSLTPSEVIQAVKKGARHTEALTPEEFVQVTHKMEKLFANKGVTICMSEYARYTDSVFGHVLNPVAGRRTKFFENDKDFVNTHKMSHVNKVLTENATTERETITPQLITETSSVQKAIQTSVLEIQEVNHSEEVLSQSEAEPLQEPQHVEETAPIDLSILYEINTSQHLKSFQDQLGVLKDKYSDLNNLIEIACNIHNAQDPSQTKALTEKLISPSFIDKMTKLISTQTMISQDYRAGSIAKSLCAKNFSESEQIGLKGNIAYIKILKSLIEENKLDGMKVFEALTKERSHSSKPHKEDKVTGYLFTLAERMKRDSNLAYSVSELLSSIVHDDPAKKAVIRTKLLASDSYSSSKISGMFGHPYNDFYGRILENGKEKNLSTSAKIAGAALKEKGLAPSKEEISKISKKRAEKYNTGFENATKFVNTSQGKEILASLSNGNIIGTELLNQIRESFASPNIQAGILESITILDEIEKLDRIASEWRNLESEVKVIVESKWHEEITKVHKKLQPGILGYILAPDQASAYQEAADKLPMTPPSSVLSDVMSELKSKTPVKDYIKAKALANHPSHDIGAAHIAMENSQINKNLSNTVETQVNNKVEAVAEKAAKEAADRAAERIAEKAAKEAAEKAAKEAAEKAAKETAEKAAKETAEKAAKETAEKAAKETAEKAAKEAAEKAAKDAALRATRDAAEKAARELTIKLAKEAADRALDREIEIRLALLRAPTPPSTEPSHRERQSTRLRQAEYLDNNGKAQTATLES